MVKKMVKNVEKSNICLKPKHFQHHVPSSLAKEYLYKLFCKTAQDQLVNNFQLLLQIPHWIKICTLTGPIRDIDTI